MIESVHRVSNRPVIPVVMGKERDTLMSIRWNIFLLPFLFSVQSHGLPSTIGQWTGFFTQGRWNENWGWLLETQTRLHDGFRFGEDPDPLKLRNNRFVFRPALNYFITSDNSVQLQIGYGWTPGLSPQRDDHRIHQQILYQKGSPQTQQWMARIRIEQRKIEGIRDVLWKGRLFARKSLRLDETWGIAAFNELFFNLNSTENIYIAGFDQNRFFMGPQVFFSDRVRWEFGYIYNYFGKSRQSPPAVAHVLALFAFFEL